MAWSPGVAGAHGAHLRVAPDRDLEDYLGGDSIAAQARNVFYAYVREGEKIEVAFTRAEDNDEAKKDGTLTVTAPDGKDQSPCVLKAGASTGKTCEFDELPQQAGVWKISYQGHEKKKASPAYWDIRVTEGKSAKHGRVWTDAYWTQQTSSRTTDESLFYLSEFGYQYQAIFRGYNGLWSQFQTNSAGLTFKKTCTPIDHSTDGMTGDFSTDLSGCGPYKIFFESPAKVLPEAVSLPDGTKTWLQVPVVAPKIGEVTFTPQAPHEVPGTFSLPVSNHNGTVNLYIDANNNGSFKNKVDRKIVWGVTIHGSGTAEIPWDGLDGEGSELRNGRELTVKATIDRVAPIYFVNSDVEGRSGGIEVVHLNGPQKDDRTVYWNDSSPDDLEVDKTSVGVDSIYSSGGARSWDFGKGSWGDNRLVQDWAYVKATLKTDKTLVVLPERAPKVSAQDSAVGPAWWQGTYGKVIMAGIVTTLVGLGALLFVSKRDTKRDHGSADGGLAGWK